ncbi:PaaI family thioesterase [Luteimonas saliphila]|uniref:PaaI family thioesterase n=1 Tax=Luteimonas saliphila TaxID=2804919 RepID=UPI00192DE4BF|nr:PaaI family thioesterase [Luteimonas saliphila]
MSAGPPDLSALIRDRLPPALRGLVPPPCLLEMQGECVGYEEGRRLCMRFPVLPRYRNPLGNMQGGFIVAALDNTIGPFSFLIAPPSATASLNTQYLRPVTPDDTSITCAAWLVERTRNTLHIHAEARNDAGRLVVLCQSVNQILPPPKLD